MMGGPARMVSLLPLSLRGRSFSDLGLSALIAGQRTPRIGRDLRGSCGDAADLAGIPLFAALTDAECAALAPLFDAASISPGVALATKGAAGYSFYILVDGAAVVTLNGEEIATYGPGDFFGEMALLGNGRRTTTVTTTEPSRLLSMFGTEFRQLQQEQQEVAAGLEEAMRKRALELDELRPGSTTSARSAEPAWMPDLACLSRGHVRGGRGRRQPARSATSTAGRGLRGDGRGRVRGRRSDTSSVE